MNPLLNPMTSIPLAINFFSAPKRLHRFSREKMEKYRDKAFRRVVEYAYTVPLYHKKYKAAGIHPSDIRGIRDIGKLPFVSKEDLIKNFPDGIIPAGCNKDGVHVVSTSGSSGKPLSIYTDFYTMVTAIGPFMRELNIFNLHWRKSKIAHIGNFGQNKIDGVVKRNVLSRVKLLYSSNNVLLLNAFDPIKEIINKLDDFKPDLITSYPATLQHLAYFKKKGFGKNINPQLINSGAEVLDEYTKRYVEEAFGCRVLNVYSSVEAGSDIAFECFEGTWHIHHDFFNLEAVDDEFEPVALGEKGHVVLTRLFGRGTPIIRYTGMEDWVTLSEEDCNCGLKTPSIKYGVEGRISSTVFLPDGRLFPSASFVFISSALNELKTNMVKQFQIVQRKIDEIDILLVIDHNLKEEKGPSVDALFEKIKEVYHKKVGAGVKINVKEVEEIKSSYGKPPAIVVSHVHPKEGYRLINQKI
ncbi:MAG: phenylacetate--CoA ligase family protein [Thermoplasmata archaeon]|nr:phenylacetate--CoA ligase family protein [Thermoplasmata archaeon]